MTIEVSVRWLDGYSKTFKASDVKLGTDLIWMKLEDERNIHIPMWEVRWFLMYSENRNVPRPPLFAIDSR